MESTPIELVSVKIVEGKCPWDPTMPKRENAKKEVTVIEEERSLHPQWGDDGITLRFDAGHNLPFWASVMIGISNGKEPGVHLLGGRPPYCPASIKPGSRLAIDDTKVRLRPQTENEWDVDITLKVKESDMFKVKATAVVRINA